MKKNFKFYIIIWATLLALFNVIAFVSVGWAAYDKYTAAFWIGYTFITIEFISQAICAYIAFKDDVKKMFYNIPLIKTSYSGLIVSFVVGGLCMLISPLPYWIGILVCAIILAINIMAVVKAVAVASEVERVDKKVKAQTFFIKSLTVDAETLMARAKSESVKADCKKVYEAIRYSDAMSNDMLSSIEKEITIGFSTLSDAVIDDDTEVVASAANELVILLGERNQKCKLLK